MWDLSSLTRDQTCVPCIGSQILNHWTTRKVPSLVWEKREGNILKCWSYGPTDQSWYVHKQSHAFTLLSLSGSRVCYLHLWERVWPSQNKDHVDSYLLQMQPHILQNLELKPSFSFLFCFVLFFCPSTEIYQLLEYKGESNSEGSFGRLDSVALANHSGRLFCTEHHLFKCWKQLMLCLWFQTDVLGCILVLSGLAPDDPVLWHQVLAITALPAQSSLVQQPS